MRYGPGDPGRSIYQEVGERIMLLRRRAGLTQTELGERLGISHVSVGALERGATRADLGNLATIADVLGVTLADIVVLERQRRPAQRPAEGGE